MPQKNKKVLIISPYFAPVNAPDMQRVRMSISFFSRFGWDAEIVTVDPAFCDWEQDPLLLDNLPKNIVIHPVKAFRKTHTIRFGLGSIALRSLFFYLRAVNRLLSTHDYDLVYFSTTQFPVVALGPYWKKKFGVPFVVDLQDPWHSNYYENQPTGARPPKYWFSYRLNKYTEKLTMARCDGIISVSAQYIKEVKSRYPVILDVPAAVITFGGYEADQQTASKASCPVNFDPLHRNIIYIGRGGKDMHAAVVPLFKALAGLPPENKLLIYFIGTSYAPAGQQQFSFVELAEQFGVRASVIEMPGRIGFYETLATLKKADALFLPGSDDVQYSPSKLYPCLLTDRPILALFRSGSPATTILKEFGLSTVYAYDQEPEKHIKDFLEGVISGKVTKEPNSAAAVQKYSAENMTRLTCALFDEVLERKYKITGN